jgi:hypothetical protein
MPATLAEPTVKNRRRENLLLFFFNKQNGVKNQTAILS